MAITILRQKINAIIQFNIVEETIAIINEYGWYIAGLLILQLQEGKDADDKNVTVFGRDFYTDATVFEKEHRKDLSPLGKFTDWITNYMSGNFYNSLKVDTKGTTFEIYSDVDYFPEILKRSGTRIMELNQEHLVQFSEEILIPQLQEKLKNYGV